MAKPIKISHQVIKVVETEINCPHCDKDGLIYEKVYHNQVQPRTCNECEGTKKIIDISEDRISLKQALIELNILN